MRDFAFWFDLITAAIWFAESLVGVALRIRRTMRLRRIRLLEPIDPRDVDYLRSVKHSTYLRLGVKVVFLIGSLIALFRWTDLFPLWRIGIVLSLGFMLAETVSVDLIRDRLGRHVEGGS